MERPTYHVDNLEVVVLGSELVDLGLEHDVGRGLVGEHESHLGLVLRVEQELLEHLQHRRDAFWRRVLLAWGTPSLGRGGGWGNV